MSDVMYTFLGAVIGASAAFLSGPLLESYKRHRDRQGVASALAGEIFAILHMTEKRKYVQSFEFDLAELKAGRDRVIENIIGDTHSKLDPVIDKHIDKLGLLTGKSKTPERITTFYTFLQGIRIDLSRLATAEFEGKIKEKAFIIEEDLALWKETAILGSDICKELGRISEEKWWPVRFFDTQWNRLKVKVQLSAS